MSTDKLQDSKLLAARATECNKNLKYQAKRTMKRASQMASGPLKLQSLIPVFVNLLLHMLISITNNCNICAGQQSARQQAIILSNIQQQNEQRQHTKPAQLMLYQQSSNSSSPMNRPLDRPSLTLVSNQNGSNRQQQQQSRSSNSSSDNAKASEIVEADWFMLGGPGDATALDDLNTSESRAFGSFAERNITSRHSTRRTAEISSSARRKNAKKGNRTVFDDEQSEASDSNEIYDDVEESSISLAGTQKEPECASHGRYYCTFKEDYPLKLVTEVTKYYKWPLEKLFRDLHAQIMPKLAQDASGNLVCDSITRVVRPGWARNTNERWLVVINTENYHQYVTEVVCQYGSNSRCNFIPPCYYSSCQQRYNTQKLLVIDPTNPYRGPFLSEFLFPSCCVCYVPSSGDNFQDRYRPSPATIYQRTMQQESAANLNPPQFRPTGLMDEVSGASSFSAAGLAAPSQSSSSSASASSSTNGADKAASGSSVAASKLSAPEPGEIRRRGGEQYRRRLADSQDADFGPPRQGTGRNDFPRLAMTESLVMGSEGVKPGDDSSTVRQ